MAHLVLAQAQAIPVALQSLWSCICFKMPVMNPDLPILSHPWGSLEAAGTGHSLQEV